MCAIRVPHLHELKAREEKIAALTAYDASLAAAQARAGVEVVLVGDSLGCVVQGHKTTVPVSVDDICYHMRCVARGNQESLLIGDMPFMSYAMPDQAIETATRLMQAGAHMIKLEGGQWVCPTVNALKERGISVCGHIGLTPQSVHKFGGYRVQGRGADSARALMEDARALEAAGVELLVLECVPQHLAREITSMLKIPTIGIGAGAGCDGQILVTYDLLGLTHGPMPSFVKVFLDAEHPSIESACAAYVQEVKAGRYPDLEHSYE
jgi:3-methyl-2-oxobutanoate hydroxymethyltransferase